MVGSRAGQKRMTLAENKRPWLILRLLPEMTRVRFYALIDHFQSPEVVLGAPAKEISALRGFDEDLARKILDAPRTVETGPEEEQMARLGVTLLTLEDPEYPENLRQSSFAPPLLFLRGRLAPSDRYALAIVGSRHATQYGRGVTQQMAGRLAACGLTIVSGFARGIDAAAHEAALRAGGRTLAILGNGHSVCYPAEHERLREDILASGGALLSEYPMQTPPDRFNFPERNHVIAAISLGTLVVEAAEKSGALITAREALEENRFVFAVPGDVTRLNSRGTNGLIQAGAKLVQRPEDILMEMRHVLRGYLREEAFAESGSPTGESAQTPSVSPRAPLTPEEEQVFQLIAHEPQHFDLLLSRLDETQVTPARLSAILLALELKQVVKQMPGKIYVSVV
ncbi:MAG: DNA-processing protein DprA [Candidatus Sumerlaeaceae bacterium]|nr:DNA-processing protein DprA [Candidatus Sumerlaeaceae bacterium]